MAARASRATCTEPVAGLDLFLAGALDSKKPLPVTDRGFSPGARPPRGHHPPQLAEIAMPLNSPLAMRFCHSAGPLACTLAPLESTATVTGMSLTSNS